ncbi:Imm12 family immunity protein [Filifactor villosus]|uniref:Imm12 family immunity protein n=1 Tax=Filifactor villosus TaxID=29374 RepID=A0ABV9QHT6_9FIRM
MELVISAVFGDPQKPADHIAETVREVRKKLKEEFGVLEMDGLEKIDMFVCFSGRLSTYYPSSGIYQSRYHKKEKKLTLTVHFSEGEWSGREEDRKIFLQGYRTYLLQLSELIRKKVGQGFEETAYRQAVKRSFESF